MTVEDPVACPEIREFYSDKKDVGQRNHELRELSESLLDAPVALFHRKLPGAKALYVSIGGAVISMAGIHLMENQHRAQKYNPKITGLAIGLVGLGMVCDLIDGKLARLIRSEMTDEKKKLDDEKKGQAIDPIIDGIIETFQYLESAWTAHKLGRKTAVKASIFNVITANVPRTWKAIAGTFAIPIEEGYKIWNPRFWGTSLGRKLPNYASTFAPHPEINGVELPVGEFANIVTGTANTKVGMERLDKVAYPPLGQPGVVPMSNKEVEFAKYRAPRLAVQSLVNIGIGFVASRILR